MKKYLIILALMCSASCMAFPPYKVVHCQGILNGHNTVLEYDRSNHMLMIRVDGRYGYSYATETGNRIYTSAILVGEIISNSIDWNAKFNLYANGELYLSGPVGCQKIEESIQK